LQLEVAIEALYQLREEKNWVAEAAEERAGRQLRAEVTQTSGCSGKKWLREE